MGNVQGSKDSNNRALRPKCHEKYRVSVLKPYYLGLWTLRATYHWCNVHKSSLGGHK